MGGQTGTWHFRLIFVFKFAHPLTFWDFEIACWGGGGSAGPISAGRGAQSGGERDMVGPVSQSLPLLLHNLFLFSHNIPISFENGSFLQVMNNERGRLDR